MHSEQHFSLCWNDHHSTLVAIFENLLESGTLVDCTIAAEGQFLKAHKVVLSACSPYFQLLLSQQNEKHPIIILKDVKFQELKAMIDYIYRGEVKISEERLGDFLEAAESLQIKGLGDGNIRDGLEKAGLTEPPSSNTRRGSSSPIPRKRHHHSHTSYTPPHMSHTSHQSHASHQTHDSHIPHMGMQTSCDEIPPNPPPVPDTHSQMASCELPPPCQPSPSSIPSTTSSPAVSTPGYNRTPCTPLVPNVHDVHDDGSDLGLKRGSLPTQMMLEPKIEYLEKTINDNCVENLTMLYDMDEMAELKSGAQTGTNSGRIGREPQMMTRARRSGLHPHAHARPLRYQCDECSKAFPRASQLKIHRRTHTGERPYKCLSCAAAFMAAGDLKRHIRMHTGERPYHCDVCTAAFKKSGDLKIHKRLHTGERPYQCELCERSFISNSDLHKHKRVHGIAPPGQRARDEAAAAAAAAASSSI